MVGGNAILLAAVTAGTAFAQNTYTGCHNHTTSGVNIEYCFGPDANESARTTYSPEVTSGSTPATNAAIATATATYQTDSITGCHSHATALFCINGEGAEVEVEATPTGEAPAQYTDCHSHGAEMFCIDPDGNDVAVLAAADDAGHFEATGTTGAASSSAVTDCHSHDSTVFCTNSEGAEVEIVSADATSEVPAQYTGCHSNDDETYCLDPAGEEVAILAEGHSAEENQHCHFHAGVEHCVGADGEEAEVDCGLRERDYNIGLRVGTLFVILVTSGIGVALPILLQKLPLGKIGAIGLMVVKQFGTGVIISTAFIHLYTHAEVMFQNQCLGELGYEATTSAVVMAGLFISFLVEYIGMRLAAWHSEKKPAEASAYIEQAGSGDKTANHDVSSQESRNAFAAVDHHYGGGGNNRLSVMVMEAGILFHSILIGLTLVVAGDSFYRTLLVVIVFHQFFEGMALGARIALLPGEIFPVKFIMAFAFTLITPVGMAIGVGVLNSFNGNNPSTVLTFGVLDALSAGILLWVGVVDMWARDWVIEGGELMASGLFRTLGAGLSLVCGMILMGVLGKWA